MADHAEQATDLYLAGNADRHAVIAPDDDGVALGFAEATIRRDYVEGCLSSPVVFLEGIYVVPDARTTGVARALSDAVADWGRAKGLHRICVQRTARQC